MLLSWVTLITLLGANCAHAWSPFPGFNCNLRDAKWVCIIDPVTTSTTTTTTTTTTTPQGQTTGCSCGMRNDPDNRIVGGQETAIHEYPWMIALTPVISWQPFCGGTIISSEWVLTAAHCVEDLTYTDFRLVHSEHDWYTSSEAEAVKMLPLEIISHPDYDSNTYAHDFALIRVPHIHFNSTVSAVCMPDSDMTTYAGEEATATGWGVTSFGVEGWQPDVLYDVELTIVSNAECSQVYAGIGSYNLCAHTVEGGKDTCQGDSGGPLVVQEGATEIHYTLVGVTSFGSGCGQVGVPGVYARVTEVLAWLVGNGVDLCQPGSE